MAADYADRDTAIQALVLSQLGVLYDEPARLLRDDLRDLAQAASILTLIGQGCHRPSEIARRHPLGGGGGLVFPCRSASPAN